MPTLDYRGSALHRQSLRTLLCSISPPLPPWRPSPADNPRLACRAQLGPSAVVTPPASECSAQGSAHPAASAALGQQLVSDSEAGTERCSALGGGGDGAGAGGGGASGGSEDGDGSDDPAHPWRLAPLVAACVYGCMLLLPPWASAALTAEAAPAVDVFASAVSDAPRTMREDIEALKRLQREAFAELQTSRRRLDDLTPRPDQDDLVIPTEGARIAPTSRRPAASLRLRSKAQLSGTLDWAGLLPCSQEGTAEGVDVAQRSTGGTGPRLSLLLQSMSVDQKHSLSARINSAAADGSSAGPGASGLQVEQLLFRRQQTPRLSLLLAPLGGALSNITRKVNPFADCGLGTAMRCGHGLTAVHEGGTGAAASWSPGACSASAGHFVEATPGGTRHHSVVQLACHARATFVACLVAAHSSLWTPRPLAGAAAAAQPSSSSPQAEPAVKRRRRGPRQDDPAGAEAGSVSSSSGTGHGNGGNGRSPAVPQDAAPLSSSMRLLGLLVPAGPRSTCGGAAFAGDGGSGAAGEGSSLGIAGSWFMADSVILSGWCSGTRDLAAPGWGVRMASAPDVEGRQLGAMLARAPRGHGRSSAPLLCEVSASMPVADGLTATPGAVLHWQNGRATAALALHTAWRF